MPGSDQGIHRESWVRFAGGGVLATLLTLGNGVCGFASLVAASRIPPHSFLAGADAVALQESLQLLQWAGWMIFAGMVLDLFDGRVARMTGAASRFGAELDSLCDVVTFGVAPAFLLVKAGPSASDAWWPSWMLFVAAPLYVVTAILRLARFNSAHFSEAESGRRFVGLPSPAAAGCLAGLVLLQPSLMTTQLPTAFPSAWVQAAAIAFEWTPVATLLLAGLMVSTIRYPHLLSESRTSSWPTSTVVYFLAGGAILLCLAPIATLTIAFWSYAVFAAVFGNQPLQDRPTERMGRTEHLHQGVGP